MTENEFDSVNQTLLEYDWIISPYLFNAPKIINFVNRLQARPTADEKARYGNMLRQEIVQPDVFNYKSRACIVIEGYCVGKIFSEYAHLYEMGLFELYRLNWLACKGIWFPLIEGVLRKFANVDYGVARISVVLGEFNRLITAQQGYGQWVDVLKKNITDFISHFYMPIGSDSDLVTFNFNRHYFAHAFTNLPIYHINNSLRLSQILDTLLAIDLMANGGYKVLFDGTDSRIKNRENRYEELLR